MKKYQIIGICLFVTTIASLYIGMLIINFLSDTSFFGTLALTHYIWIIWLFTPIPVSTFVFGVIFRKKVHVMIDIIGGAIVFFMMLGIGCLFFIDYKDTSGSFLIDVQNTTNISFPTKVKAMSSYEVGGRRGIAKILDHDQEEEFKNNMTSDKWEEKCPINARVFLPSYVVNETEKAYEKYCLYLLPADAYNPEIIESGKYSVCYIAYNSSLHKLFVFDKYSIEI